jgi:hypothetical protein
LYNPESFVIIIQNWILSAECGFQGGSWGESALTDELQMIKNAGVAGVIYWPDHDDTGYKKAQKCSEIAAKIGLPFIEINPLKIWSECPQKGDIADFAINNNRTYALTKNIIYVV